MEYTWDHISLTGAGAGLTACGRTLRATHDAGDRTAHIPYSFTDTQIRTAYQCEECVKAWFADDEGEG
jgi:hypothetical protein